MVHQTRSSQAFTSLFTPNPLILNISTCFSYTVVSGLLSFQIVRALPHHSQFTYLHDPFQVHLGVLPLPKHTAHLFRLFTFIYPLFRIHFGILASLNTRLIPFFLLTSIHPLLRVHFGGLASLDGRNIPSPFSDSFLFTFIDCPFYTALILASLQLGPLFITQPH